MDQPLAISDLSMHVVAAEDMALGLVTRLNSIDQARNKEPDLKGFIFLHAACNGIFPTAELLDLHFKPHFKEPNIDHGIHPYNSLAAVYAAVNQYDDHVVGTSPANHNGQTSGSAPTMSNNPFHPSSSNQSHSRDPSQNTLFLCPTCGRTIDRSGDLERHAKKHDPAMRVFQCEEPGCEFKGTYRKEKLNAHVRTCHQ
ncbi:hypothetical protein ABVK25_008707 [Lepraria finkii]|uniref:C2H2-type domain-containing protein n=1 Tax=Lepraria finkii TaxID=1340010 RepID=A0ABR4B1S5_9LECA